MLEEGACPKITCNYLQVLKDSQRSRNKLWHPLARFGCHINANGIFSLLIWNVCLFLICGQETGFCLSQRSLSNKRQNKYLDISWHVSQTCQFHTEKSNQVSSFWLILSFIWHTFSVPITSVYSIKDIGNTVSIASMSRSGSCKEWKRSRKQFQTICFLGRRILEGF